MAFYDWNKDGKKDVQDDFIEYNIYKQSTQNNNNNNYRSNGGMSNFGAGCATVASIFIAAGILSVFNLEGAALVCVYNCSIYCCGNYCHFLWIKSDFRN